MELIQQSVDKERGSFLFLPRGLDEDKKELKGGEERVKKEREEGLRSAEIMVSSSV